MGPRCAQDGPRWAQVAPKMAQAGRITRKMQPRWPKMAKITFKMRLEIAMIRFWRHLGGLWGGFGRSGGSRPLQPGGGLAGCATTLEDEVFEEEESEELEVDSARPCTLSATAGGGVKPAERGPGGSLTATYCTPCEEPKKILPPP